MVHGDNQQATPSEAEIAWLSGIIEGEGSLSLSAHVRRDSAKPKVQAVVRIYNSDAGIIDKCVVVLEKLGIGYFVKERALGPELKVSGKTYKARDPILEVQVKKFSETRSLVRTIRPWLFGNKRYRADLMLRFLDRRLARIEDEGGGNTRLPFNKDDLQPVSDFYKLTRVNVPRELEGVLND